MSPLSARPPLPIPFDKPRGLHLINRWDTKGFSNRPEWIASPAEVFMMVKRDLRVGTSRIEKTLDNVRALFVEKNRKGYTIKAEVGEILPNHRIIRVPKATNFEWRIERGHPVKITHLYFGAETGRFRDFSFNISFEAPCRVRISNPDARCYLYLEQIKAKAGK